MEERFIMPVKEEVHFPEEEEVESLLSVSLDPQLHASNHMMQGFIDVTGEYVIRSEGEETRQFFRQIPVYAILPERLAAAADEDVHIHSFDYKIDPPNRLFIEAEIGVILAVVSEEEPAKVAVQAEEPVSADEQEPEKEEASVSVDRPPQPVAEQVSTQEAESQEAEFEEAAVQVQKTAEDTSKLFRWLDVVPEEPAKWRFNISTGNVELISTQGEAPQRLKEDS